MSGHAIRDEIVAVMEKHGVQTFHIAFADPDSDQMFRTAGGEAFRLIGYLSFCALDLMKERESDDNKEVQ